MSEPAFPGRVTRDDPDLTPRQRQVFEVLVRLHGRTARPVASDTLAGQPGVRVSSASVRGDLAELEALGLLERTHTSGGRVPSARGYEYYVRALLTPAVLPAALLEEVERVLEVSSRDVEHLLGQASRLLSSLTHQLGLAVAASLDHEPLMRLDLEALGERRALMVLGLGGGAVQTLVLELENPLDRDELASVGAVLRERLIGCPLFEVRERLAADPELVRRSAVRLVSRAAAESWSRLVSTPILSAGAAHMTEHPEFASSHQLGSILRVVETGSPLDRLMVASAEGHASVRVGVDEDQALAGCSLVSYALPGALRAAVGILGPLRMDYSQALAAVDTVGSRVAELLQG
jgi:heat-inducible transcriptional repressor